ncbi:MAG TPA: ATP-binding protein [Alphaproteobacteria bacterium]|nr:ATP-binding protein [Alphaproteobacteria bacterium]
MSLSRMSAGRLIFTTFALTAPTLVLLVILALHGELAWGHVFTAGGAVAVALFFLVRRHLFEMSVVIAAAEALADRDSAAPAPLKTPRLGGRLTGDALAAVIRLDRIWRERAEALRGGIGENRGVFDSLPDPLILLDKRRRVTFGNQAARQLLGNIAVGGDLALALRDPAVLEAVDGVLTDGTGRQAEFRAVQPSERFFAVRIEKLRLPAPAIDMTARAARETIEGGAVCVLAMVDVSAAKRSEQMRSDFIANASHELRTPLSSLIGFIETLQGPARDDPKAQEQFLKLMHEQAQRMARLVRDLLSLSMIEMSEHKPPAGQVDVPALIQTVVAVLQLQARAKGIAVKLTVDGEAPKIAGDADQLAQLFQNLIDNAIKYGAPDSEVAVRIWTTTNAAPDRGAEGAAGGDLAIPQAALAVSVADQGDGIGEEHLPRLTERFYRVDTARSRAVGGTGLGLAIVKHILARHRGRLQIDSQPGQGSRFTVYLPLDAIASSAE